MKRILLFAGLAVVAIMALGAGGIWYFLIRSDAPAAASLDAARAALASATPSGASSTASPTTAGSPAATGTAAATTPTSPGGTVTLAGEWKPDTSVAGATFVGYRVGEELVGIGTTTAVGRTPGVTGSVIIEGTTLTAATITADMTKLTSDRSQRDGQLRNQGIEYARFPTSVFTLTEPIELPAALATGSEVSATITGTLLLHGVTKEVTLPIQAQLTNGNLLVVGSLEILFADYNISKPSGASVLSIEDHGILELQLVLKK